MTSLSKIKMKDYLLMKECMDTFLYWFIAHAADIERIADCLLESEEDVVTMILGNGLRKMEDAAEIASDAVDMEG